MTLMVNGKKVLGYAIGGNEFYSLDKIKVSALLMCSFNGGFPNNLSVSLDQPLSPGSAFTLRYLRDKGEKIRLIVTFLKTIDGTASSLESGTIDLSKPDSKGNFNFNFQWVNNIPVKNAYCSYDPSDSKFIVYSDAFNWVATYYMQVLYLD